MVDSARRILFQSAWAPERLAAARVFASEYPASTELVVVGATRDAADDFVREIAATKKATFGLHRFSFAQLVSRLAQNALSKRSLSPATRLTVEAVMARVTFDLLGSSSLHYLKAVARFPGFSVAAASTISELRTAGISPTELRGVPLSGADLADIAEAFETALGDHALADSAEVYRVATDALLDSQASPLSSHPLVLLDVAISTAADEKFLSALLSQARSVFATVPVGDSRASILFRRLGLTTLHGAQDNASSLGRLRTHLFSADDPPRGTWDETVRFFSAPGEGRECIEIARMILREAERGIRFDEMAILLRSPQAYAAHLETSMRRAGIPLFIARGAKRPSPTGRSFLALLACAGENLSARRFAEYLSLGQVPPVAEGPRKTPEPPDWVPSEEDLLSAGRMDRAPEDDDHEDPGVSVPRAPRRWERLLVEAAVVGGKDRWKRRLEGLRMQMIAQREELCRIEPGSPRIDGLAREIAHLDQLRDFALPLVAMLEDLRNPRTWDQWLEELRALAIIALRRPRRVLRLLAELAPLADTGPVGVAEVHAVLERRLLTLEKEQPERRHGCVFVAGIDQARGRAFKIVFIPGLAERMFPQKVAEDPLLLDDARLRLSGGLRTQEERLASERLLLQVAAGSAADRLYLSYPRLETGAQGRGRVPSFYGLDVARAISGTLPDYRELEHSAFAMTRARLAMPAPEEPELAIDPLEYDLSVLHPLLHGGSTEVRGRARFLMDLNASLGRSLRARWQRWAKKWTPADGLVHPSEHALALLGAHRLTARPYSISSLQRFAVCPYQFFLSAIHQLAPREELDALQAMDPLIRGHILHRIQADVLSELRGRGELPVNASNLDAAEARAREVVARVGAEYAERLAPVVGRLWVAEIEAIRMDVLLWVRHMAETRDGWVPLYFELGFGLSDDINRDPASVKTPAAVGSKGWLLRGSIDLIEQGNGGVRVTDYKTGRDQTKQGLVVGGGELLQPVFYGLATEKVLERPVSEGRLFFSTLRGGFSQHIVQLQKQARSAAETVLSLVDSCVEQGFMPPAPRKDACLMCDFRSVCGPREERRSGQKESNSPLLMSLATVRGMK